MKNYWAILPFFSLLPLMSCRQEKENVGREEAERLFIRTCRTAAIYTDSLKKAKDSTEVTSLIERFEQRLVEINYEASPDTDYALSEGENDTIKMALDTLMAVRIRRLIELGKRNLETTDSVDSITAMDNMHLTPSTVKIQ